MVKTYGLTHINIAVRDLDRTLRFYREVFGVTEYVRRDGIAHTFTPGNHDVITFEEKPEGTCGTGGIAHFGFRLVDPKDIDAAVEQAGLSGGKLLRRGDFAPGVPYAYVADPDGYEVEIWFE